MCAFYAKKRLFIFEKCKFADIIVSKLIFFKNNLFLKV
jgi:hypothetical protein